MSKPTKKGKQIAIIAHLTFVGMLIAFFMNLDEQDRYARFYIRQMFGLVLLLIVAQVTMTYIHNFMGSTLWTFSFLGWVYSGVMVFTNEEKPLPLLGNQFQIWFKNIG
ncbi:MAG: hypothetical protein RQ756_02255 [Flavobacteriaceae bacterium]|nr:hypothetical protein [Flavobacteriaceae bacterium]